MKKILVVEDDQMMREIVVEFLKDKNFEVFEASSGSEALAIIDNEKPNLVLQDVCLPDMTGLQVMEQGKATSPETIFLVVTGLEEEETARKAIALGAFDYLVKPINFEELQQRFLDQLFPN